MRSAAVMDAFLDELDETIEVEGQILVGHFAWILRGMELGLTQEQLLEVCREAYPIVRRRHQLRLMWTSWPTDPDTARPADDSTELEFDLDPDEPVEKPILCLFLED